MNEQTREILIILAEEAAEVVQATMKTFRFGPDQVHLKSPDGRTQIQNLEMEIGDLLAMVQLLVNENCGVSWPGIDAAKAAKYQKLKVWSSINVK